MIELTSPRPSIVLEGNKSQSQLDMRQLEVAKSEGVLPSQVSEALDP